MTTFEEIYKQHADMVYNLSMVYLQNLEDAQEATQDVFVKVFDKINGFRQDSELKTWIYRITINQSIDYLKSKQRQKRNFIFSLFDNSSESAENQIPDFNHPGISLENKEELENLMLKIYQLPENQKTVIFLLKIEDLSQKEVAEIMKLSEGAVESLFQRAKTSLKKLL